MRWIILADRVIPNFAIICFASDLRRPPDANWRRSMKKKIFLGLGALPLLVVGGWLVLKLPFIMEGKACLGRDHVKGASACAKLLSRKEFADQDLARATMVLTQAAHLLTLPDGERGELPTLLAAAEKILLDPAAIAAAGKKYPDASRRLEMAASQVVLYRWVLHTLSNRQDLALKALLDAKKSLGSPESAAGKTLRSLLGCGVLPGGNWSVALENLAPLGFPKEGLALLGFLSADYPRALNLAQDSGAAALSIEEMTEALTLAALGRNTESLRLLDGFLNSKGASQLPARARAGLLAARGTLLRLSGDRRARADFDAALALGPDAELRAFLLLERGKLSEVEGQVRAALSDYSAVRSSLPEQVYFAILSSADLLADIQPAQARLLLGELLKVRPGEYEVLVLHAYLEWRGKRAAAAKSLLAQAVASSSRRYLRPARCRQRLAAMKRDKRLAAAAAAAMSSLGTTPDDMSHFRSVVGLAALAPLVERLASACRETNNNTLAKFSGKTLK